MNENFTNERFHGLFKSNFELVNYAIRLGRYKIKAGQETTLDSILDDVEDHPNPSYLTDLQEADRLEEQEKSDAT